MSLTYRATLRAFMRKYEESNIWSRKHIRSQMAGALLLWRKGLRPEDNHSDLLRTFWCLLPEMDPEWYIRYTQPMSWNGLRETPIVWNTRERYRNQEAAANVAHYIAQHERFGHLGYEVRPIRSGLWRTYNSPMP